MSDTANVSAQMPITDPADAPGAEPPAPLSGVLAAVVPDDDVDPLHVDESAPASNLTISGKSIPESKGLILTASQDFDPFTTIQYGNWGQLFDYAQMCGVDAKGCAQFQNFLSEPNMRPHGKQIIQLLDITDPLTEMLEDLTTVLTGSVTVETSTSEGNGRRGRNQQAAGPPRTQTRGYTFRSDVEQRVFLLHIRLLTTLPVPDESRGGIQYGPNPTLYVVFPHTDPRALHPETGRLIVDRTGRPAGYRSLHRLILRRYSDRPEQGVRAWLNQSPRGVSSLFGLQLASYLYASGLALGADPETQLLLRETSWIEGQMERNGNIGAAPISARPITNQFVAAGIPTRMGAPASMPYGAGDVYGDGNYEQ